MNNKIYEIVRDNVLEMLDDCGRWLKPWESNVKFAKPYFSDIDEYYQGINILLNRATEYITFKKIQELNEAEAEAVRIIFEKYAYTDMGSLAIAKYLATQGIKKIPRQNGKNELFSETFVRAILDNPVYVGKIAFGRRKTEKIKGSAPVTSSLSASNKIFASTLSGCIDLRNRCVWIQCLTFRENSSSKPFSIRKQKAFSPPTIAWHTEGFSNCAPRPISCSKHAVISTS